MACMKISPESLFYPISRRMRGYGVLNIMTSMPWSLKEKKYHSRANQIAAYMLNLVSKRYLFSVTRFIMALLVIHNFSLRARKFHKFDK